MLLAVTCPPPTVGADVARRVLLREEVGRFRRGESRRVFDASVHVGVLAGPRTGFVARAQDVPALDAALKVDVDEQAMLAQSWVPVYPGADWHERECWEMFGVIFEGHPALRHLYLPSEFEGFPLRKDFALLSRVVKPWPGLVDVEPMPEEAADDETVGEAVAAEAGAESGVES